MVVKTVEKIVDYYRENKLSHAYLIETNDQVKTYDDLLKIIKMISCENEFNDGCTKCNLCNLINQNYLPSLIVVEPDGASIKKEQIINLKNSFSSMPVLTKNNIYIIKQAEKLNDSSANTMLKFLEEPQDNIIGFFITNNSNNVINTIKSRCEIITFNYEKNIDDITTSKYYDFVLNYLNKIEVEKKFLIMYNKDIFEVFPLKEDIVNIFQIILKIYSKALDIVLGICSDISYLCDFNYLLNNSSEALTRKVNLIIKLLEDINSNVNKELLLDKFLIELGDIND